MNVLRPEMDNWYSSDAGCPPALSRRSMISEASDLSRSAVAADPTHPWPGNGLAPRGHSRSEAAEGEPLSIFSARGILLAVRFPSPRTSSSRVPRRSFAEKASNCFRKKGYFSTGAPAPVASPWRSSESVLAFSRAAAGGTRLLPTLPEKPQRLRPPFPLFSLAFEDARRYPGSSGRFSHDVSNPCTSPRHPVPDEGSAP